MKFYSSTFVALFRGAERAWRYIIRICFTFGHWRTTSICFYCILKGLFCISEGTKTWGHSRDKAILSGQLFVDTCGYMYWLVFSEKRNRLKYWIYFWNIQTPRPTFCHIAFYGAAYMTDFALYSV